jgi:hypothetical protein
MALAEDLEEELGAGLGKRHIAEFLDDEQFDGGELALEFEEMPLVARFHEHLRPSLFESDFEKGGPRKWLGFTSPHATALCRRSVAYYCSAA